MKKYYQIDEKIFVSELKCSGIVKAIDVENKEVIVSYFAGKNEEGKPIFKQDNFKFWQINKYRELDKITFAKVKPEATIPSKRREDGAYDIYCCFEEESIQLPIGEIRKVSAGIASAFSPKYRIKIRERSSSGSNGLTVKAGLIDSGFRNEWQIVLNNTTNKEIIITKNVNEIKIFEDRIEYPYSKAIAQAVVEYTPNVRIREISYDELKEIPSERGMGGFGSTNK